MNETVRKELYVAVHGQTARFRVVKYILIFGVGGAIYWKWGGEVLAWTLLRYMSNGWMDDWGPYKSLFK
jgi:hypothetical protein